jgi:F-type H+-transporting ATPase subunit c
MDSLAFGLTYALPAMGAAIGAGLVGFATLQAAGRNPEKVNDFRTLMILGISFIDALAIIGIIVAIIGRVL